MAGVVFAILWASAAIALKFGIKSADPLTLALMRFMIAGPMLLLFVYAIRRNDPLPKGKEWGQLLLFGFLNTTIYTGCFAVSVSMVSAGLINLFIAVSPLLIVLLSAFWLKRKITKQEMAGFLVCSIGLVIAAFPKLGAGNSNVAGLCILAVGMLGYAIASVYYSSLNIPFSGFAFNAWQMTFGGLMMLPVALLMQTRDIVWDVNFIGTMVWLVVMLSIITMALWFYLLKKDAVRASQWLYVSPIAGYFMAYFVLGEDITLYAMFGTVLVIGGLYLGKKSNKVSGDKDQ